MQEKLLLTPKETQELLGISATTLWRMVQAGTIKQVRLASRVTRYRTADIMAIIDPEGVKACREEEKVRKLCLVENE